MRARTAVAGLGFVLAGCAASPPAGAPTPGPVAATPVSHLGWPAFTSCAGLVQAVLALPTTERARLDPATSPFAVGVIDQGALLPPPELERAVDVDLPARALEPNEPGDCTLLVERPQAGQGSGRKVVGRELVRSERRVGPRRSTNPDYQRLEEAEDAAERGGGGRIMSTGDPMLDLVGLIGGTLIDGVDRLVRGSRRNEPEPAPEAAAYEPYSYEVSLVEATRAGFTPLALYERREGAVVRAGYASREERRFRVAQGRNRADRGVLEKDEPETALPADVDLFEGTPVRPKLSELLRSAVLAGAGSSGTLADAVRALREVPRPGAAPTVLVPVKVATAGGEVSGTWLDDSRIEVPSASLGRSSLVEIEGADGQHRFGLVERIDLARGTSVVRIGDGAAGSTGGLMGE